MFESFVIVNSMEIGNCKLLGSFNAVARAGVLALVHSGGVELAAHDRVLHADILHAATAKQDDRVLLEIVADARDVRRYLHPVGESYTGDFTNSGVRLPRRFRRHLHAHATLKGRRVIRRAVLKRIEATCKRRHRRFKRSVLTPLLRELIDGGHLQKEDPRWVENTIYKYADKRNYSSGSL